MKHKFRIRDFSTELAVGGLFFFALLILGYFTIVLSTDDWFKTVYERKVCFEQVGGLIKGDHVLVRGIRIGTVADLELVDEGVLVHLSLTEDIEIREGYMVVVRTGTILGGQFVAIDPGPLDGAPIPRHVILEGNEPLNLMDEAAAMVRDVRGEIDDFRKSLEEAETIERIIAIIDNISAVSEDIRRGRGLVGRLIVDEEFFLEVKSGLDTLQAAGGNVAALAARAEAAIIDVREGKGTLGRLATDETLYDDLQAITEGLRQGRGTVGRLLTDDEVHENVRIITANIREFTERMQREDSSFASLFNDGGELYRNVSSSFRSLAKVGESLAGAEGSLGRIIHDDELYQETMEIMRELQSAVQDFREQSAVATFGSFFFGAF